MERLQEVEKKVSGTEPRSRGEGWGCKVWEVEDRHSVSGTC